MYCRNCGKEIPDGSQFCKYCGATQKGELKVPQTPSNTEVNKSEDSGSMTKVFIAIGVFIVLFMGYFLFFHRPTIDPSHFVSMEFYGSEGDCHWNLYVDYKALTGSIGRDAITRAIQKVSPNYWIWWGDPNDYDDQDFVESLYDFDVDYVLDKKNGDVCTVRIIPGDLGYATGATTLSELNDIMKINIKSPISFTISGLDSNGSSSIPSDDNGGSGNNSSQSQETTEYGKVEILKNKIKIRQWASTSAPQIGYVNSGEVYTIYGVHEADGYTWYCIGNEMYIATKEGDWTRHINN